MITGGGADSDYRSVELWAPGAGTTTTLSCPLPSMVRDRWAHSLTGTSSSMVCCGGTYETDSNTSCEVFSEGRWRLLNNYRWRKMRQWHSAWLLPSTNTTFLIGGGASPGSSSSVETVSSGKLPIMTRIKLQTFNKAAQPALTLKHGVG